MAFLETSWEEERREVWESVLECLEHEPDPDGEAACSFLLSHLGVPPAYANAPPSSRLATIRPC
jgi:hypothetical protein